MALLHSLTFKDSFLVTTRSSYAKYRRNQRKDRIYSGVALEHDHTFPFSLFEPQWSICVSRRVIRMDCQLFTL